MLEAISEKVNIGSFVKNSLFILNILCSIGFEIQYNSEIFFILVFTVSFTKFTLLSLSIESTLYSILSVIDT